MKNITCIVCPNGCELSIEKAGEEWKVTGQKYNKGVEFALEEMTNPKRSITSTVRTVFPDMARLPVRTSKDVPKDMILPIMREINKIKLDRSLHGGDIIIPNVLDTGADIISCSDMYLFLEG